MFSSRCWKTNALFVNAFRIKMILKNWRKSVESNSQLPYSISKSDDGFYSFTTKHGIIYHAYFVDYSIFHHDFKNVYTFNIEPEDSNSHPIDVRIAITIVDILRKFFDNNTNAMIMICDTLDGKEEKRRLLFSRWFDKYNDGRLNKYDASAETEDYSLYVSLYLHKNNPDTNKLVSAFYDLVKNNLYPLE